MIYCLYNIYSSLIIIEHHISTNMTVNLRDLSRTIAEFAFLTALVCNSLLIYLTARRTKNITGAYKYMIILFALLGLIFSCTEMLARPFVHNFNASFVYFSLSNDLSEFKSLVQMLLVLYSGLYSSLISFVAVQFIYRYMVLVK